MKPEDTKNYKATLARVKRNNKRFKQLTKAEKRVAIAKDVLASLKLKQIVAQGGTYISHEAFDNGDKLPVKAKCDVCALGAMFIGLTNEVSSISVHAAKHACLKD